jgi:hypothetical protein
MLRTGLNQAMERISTEEKEQIISGFECITAHCRI